MFLLDSGESVTVPLSSVRPLRAAHARLPAQAVRCWAKGARPASASGWTDEEVGVASTGDMEVVLSVSSAHMSALLPD